MQVVSRSIVSFFDCYDILVLPVYRHAPIKIGEWENLEPEMAIAKIIDWIAPCPASNASGLPAIALPVGFDERGLPVGVQLVGRPAAEGLLICLAAQLEAELKWQDRRPAIAIF
jgi:amidase